jgi:hypothetical protein
MFFSIFLHWARQGAPKIFFNLFALKNDAIVFFNLFALGAPWRAQIFFQGAPRGGGGAGRQFPGAPQKKTIYFAVFILQNVSNVMIF